MLQKHGLKVYLRNPNSYTPVLSTNQSLTLWCEGYKTQQEIAKFSTQDAEVQLLYITATSVHVNEYRYVKNLASLFYTDM